MEPLRKRLEQIEAIASDSVLFAEKRVFNRLLYRNRNQHRHGRYFQRLEHVRRLLKKIELHEVWRSVQHARGDPKKGERSKGLLSVSNLTLEDLQSAESLLNLLVHNVIPSTSSRITTELIAREHFLPFAITILASLSRIFVIERRLLSEIRGAVVELKLLFPPVERLSEQNKDGNVHDVVEDIGQEIKQMQDVRTAQYSDSVDTPTAKPKASMNPNSIRGGIQESQKDSGVASLPMMSSNSKRSKSQNHNSRDYEEAMGAHISQSDLPVVGETISHALPAKKPRIDSTSALGSLVQSNIARKPSPLPSAQVVNPEASGDKPNSKSSPVSATLTQKQGMQQTGQDNRHSSLRQEEASDCDSDDLDDIFDGMED